MLKHYIIIAIRNFFKYKLQTVISIAGLAIGLVCFAYGINWLKYETSYDGFYPRSKQIYMLYGVDKQTGKKTEQLPLILARRLKQDFPEVIETTQIYGKFGSDFYYNGERLSYPEEIFIDEYYFSFFPRKVICGRQDNILQSLNEIAVTRSFAVKLFGSPENALDKVLSNGYRESLKIVSILENTPDNSLFKGDIFELDQFGRKGERERTEEEQWSYMNVKIYLLLDKNTHIDTFEKKITDYTTVHKYNETISLKLIPLTAIRHTFGSELSFNLTYIRTFTITGLLLLLCVFFNFINLQINRTYIRIREMKLRCAIGAGKKEMLCQLLLEYSLLIFIATLLAWSLMEITAPLFRHVFDTTLDSKDLYADMIKTSLLSWLITIFISLPLSFRFIRTSQLLASGGVAPHRKNWFRKIALTIQLGICVFFLMSAFILIRQTNLMGHKDLGFEKEGLIQLIMLNDDREGTAREIASLPIVKELVLAKFFSIMHEPSTQNDVKWEGKSPNAKADFQILEVSKNFLSAFKIPLLKGRLLEETDLVKGSWRLMSTKALINEEAARIMGYTNPIGKKLSFWNNQQQNVEIVGIVKDFQSASLRNTVLPVIILLHPAQWRSYCYYVKVNPGDEPNAIKAIREAYKKHAFPYDQQPEITTVNDVLKELSRSEDASLQLFSLLAILCTLISIFGLYSISSGNIAQRRKEVAVRKVMGATSRTIISMFVREYLSIALIANLVALPLAWLFMHGWLEQYPYRISIHLWMYITILLLTIILIISTVLYQTLKASETNPAEVIKSE
ncbi:ABC transporter permease [Parabacteroides sp. AF18-52]|jgi:hypothetical protein|uniref:ABC transporter permease n=1 Tax=Parabacteroides TaxID=375288 RepID=UPI000F00A5C9|nr:ABC transporter permease [Parabacteroides sp. AF18-52]RHR42007.1 ABC transporter permease [Parabacteroides sp. AF18-52]